MWPVPIIGNHKQNSQSRPPLYQNTPASTAAATPQRLHGRYILDGSSASDSSGRWCVGGMFGWIMASERAVKRCR